MNCQSLSVMLLLIRVHHSQWCEWICWSQWSRFPQSEEGEVIINLLHPSFCTSRDQPHHSSVFSLLLSCLSERKKNLWQLPYPAPWSCTMSNAVFAKPSHYYEWLKEKWLWGITERVFLFPVHSEVHMLFAFFCLMLLSQIQNLWSSHTCKENIRTLGGRKSNLFFYKCLIIHHFDRSERDNPIF